MNQFKAEIIANWEIIKKNLTAAMALRTAFVMQVVGMMVNNSFLLMVWVFFFQSFGRINGWSVTEYIGMLGINTAGFGIAMSVFYGSAMLPRLVDNGSFDSLLLSPRRLYFRILTSALNMSAVGDFLWLGFNRRVLVFFQGIFRADCRTFILGDSGGHSSL